MPCIVFLKNINDKDVLIYSLSNKWSDEKISKELKELFSILEESVPFSGKNLPLNVAWGFLQYQLKKKEREKYLRDLVMHPLVNVTIATILKKIIGMG